MKKRIFCVTLAVCMALLMFAGCTSGTKTDDKTLSESEFFKLAIDQRFDYVPLFDAGSTFKDTSDYLMYAFILNADELKEAGTPVTMSKEYVEEVIHSHFLVSDEIKHRPLLHTWDYADETYTASAWAYNYEPMFRMLSCEMSKMDDKVVYNVKAMPIGIVELITGDWINESAVINSDNPSPELLALFDLAAEYNVKTEGKTFYEVMVALLDAGAGDKLPQTKRVDSFSFYIDAESGNAVFLSHQVTFETPVIDEEAQA